ncbi:MAG: 3-hydroxyacyl-CoA dehydrogenase family protein [Pseudomonadota bacterium]
MTSDETAALLQDRFWLAVEHLIYRHVAPWELDEALEQWGYANGPCAAQDEVGLEQVLWRRGDVSSPVLKRMVAEGRLGRSLGWGFYRYPGGGGAVVDPLIEDLIREEAWFAKFERQDLADEQVIRRSNAELINAALSLVEDGQGSAAEINRLTISATAFPKGRGGALAYLGRIGAPAVLADLSDGLACRLLLELADKGEPILR